MSDTPSNAWNQTLSIVKSNGWCIRAVEAAGYPVFSYTIGMAEKDLPELIITGLKTDVAGHYLGMACDFLVDGTFSGQDEEVLPGMANTDFKFRELDLQDVEEIMFDCIRYAKDISKPLRFLQIIYPDPNRFFPGDPACNEKYSKLQSLKGLKS